MDNNYDFLTVGPERVERDIPPEEMRRKLETTKFSLFDHANCEHCPNNPKNGGNGVCACILGCPIIY